MSAVDPMGEDDEMLAAELAFGLIDGAERQTAEARVTTDPAFAAAHRRWLSYAVAILAGGEVSPRPSIWTAIEARLPANDTAPVTPQASVRWWQAGTLVASAAAVLLGVVATERATTPVAPPHIAQPAPPLVAMLTGTDKGFVAVSYDPATGRLTSTPTGVSIGDHSAQLWVIPTGQSPRSLGVIAAGAPGWTHAPGKAAPAITPGATFAITVEPIGGSPTGNPTGPVILSGKVMTI
jgi:anti-sigma-K factor RskA